MKYILIFDFLIFFIVIPFTQAVLDFRDEYFYGWEADRFDWSRHPCRRQCENDNRMKCHYVFVVEKLSAMSKACYDCPYNVTDCYRPHCMPTAGYQRSIIVANRQFPGPTIEVCENDTIVVEVRNAMTSDTTTIHWHGIKQRGTQFMDGVPYITQCPILPGEQFTYIYKADTHGTYFWHSHMGKQRADGLFGALIIHPMPKHNKHIRLYDFDNQYMLLNDWNELPGTDSVIREFQLSGMNITTLLVNGLGRYQPFRRNNMVTYTPVAQFRVRQNYKYRFRLVNAGSEDCPIEMSIDNHILRVISVDSRDLEPVDVDTVTIWPGERIDFVVHANQPVDNYWIRYRGYGQCRTNSTSGAFQTAILRYSGSKNSNPRGAIGYAIPKHTRRMRIFNPYQRGTESDPSEFINIPQLNSMDPNDRSLYGRVDYQEYITFDFYPLDNYDYHRKNLYGYNQVQQDRRIGTFQLNHITFKFPSFPLQTQWHMIGPNTLCNQATLSRNCTSEQCSCTQVLKFRLNSVVELIFVDEGRYATINHPLHLHGFFFRVIATENLDGPVSIERVKRLDAQGRIQRRLDHPPLKDTIKAPGGGYTIIRFYADNPGFWYFHCHFDPHDNIGMALVVQVGEYEDFAPPPRGFPTCHSFTPKF